LIAQLTAADPKGVKISHDEGRCVVVEGNYCEHNFVLGLQGTL